MKALIVIAMVIIFISVFFILLVFDNTVKPSMLCMQNTENPLCSGYSTTGMIFGISIIGFFTLIDIAVIYIVFKTATSSGSVAYMLR